MWPLVKSFAIGNPWVIAGAFAAAIVWSGGCVGYGYYHAVGQYEAAQLSNQQALVAGQHEKDVAEHNRAIAEGKLASARKQVGQTHIAAVQTEIAALPAFAGAEACAPNDDVVRLLNEAGK